MKKLKRKYLLQWYALGTLQAFIYVPLIHGIAGDIMTTLLLVLVAGVLISFTSNLVLNHFLPMYCISQCPKKSFVPQITWLCPDGTTTSKRTDGILLLTYPDACSYRDELAASFPENAYQIDLAI